MRLIPSIKNIFDNLNNIESITYSFCNLLGVPVTKGYIRDQLAEHPDFPSLLSMGDVLSSLGVGNLGAKVDLDQLEVLETPFISLIKTNHTRSATIVSAITEDSITYLEPDDKVYVTVAKETFSQIFGGVILITEVSDKAGQKDYQDHVVKERKVRWSKMLAGLSLPLFAFVMCMKLLFTNGISAVYPVAYTLLCLLGVGVGSMLLWYEIDQHNPTLQQICNGSAKTNCKAILNSTASKIFGISWSAIGFMYFSFGLVGQLVSGIDNPVMLALLSWLNVAALPYTIFSIYYQAKVARHWCVMCLAVQLLLILQFVVALLGGFHTVTFFTSISFSLFPVLFFSFCVPFLIVSLLVPALRKAKEGTISRNDLKRLKHNSSIFNALLEKEKMVSEPTEGLGITVGNPNARHHLIKVCSPYCGLCSKAHPLIDELLDNNQDVKLQIIFSSYDNDFDISAPAARHMLAIFEKGDESLTKKALDDWYLPEKKDYQRFAEKYPVDGDLGQQGKKLQAMRDWCDKVDVAYTPTFFINGRQLSELYTVTDLKYFLSV